MTKKEISRYMAELGRNGGKSRSKRKVAAARRNMLKINARKKSKISP